MKISVKVKTNARKNAVEKIDEKTYAAWVTASPIDGKANKAVIDLFAHYFGVPKSTVSIHSGTASRNKIIDITL